jgi:hypothetical protein
MSDEIRFARCQRCNLSMRVRVQTGNPNALLMRHSETGEGLCASCAATRSFCTVWSTSNA